jgi:WD repeat-containing protein 60
MSDDYGYDDDFDDYEDDFDDEFDQDVNEDENDNLFINTPVSIPTHAIQTPQYSSTQTATAAAATLSFLPEPERKFRPIVRHNPPPPRIATANTRAASRAELDRIKCIRSSVQLCEEEFDLFELQPVREYDSYVRETGLGCISSVACQYNDEWIDVSTQTETNVQVDAGAQCPEDSMMQSRATDTILLQSFVQQAASLLESVLTSNLMTHSGVGCGKQTLSSTLLSSESKSVGSSTVSDHLRLDTTVATLLHNRRMVDASIHTRVHPIGMAVAFDHPSAPVPEAKHTDHIHRRLMQASVICIWTLPLPKNGAANFPTEILYCDASISCMYMHPLLTHLVFAGTDEGSIVLWDLREDPSMHTRLSLSPSTDALATTCRHPTFATDAIADLDAEGGSIIQLDSIVDTQAASVQLFSLHESGACTAWTTVELHKGDWTGSKTDYGLFVGGRVKLMKSMQVPLKRQHQSVLGMCINPHDASDILIAQSNGVIRRINRFGDPVQPSSFSPVESFSAQLPACTSIAFCSETAGYFAAGYSDGSVCVFRTDSSESICSGFASTVCSIAGDAVVRLSFDKNDHIIAALASGSVALFAFSSDTYTLTIISDAQTSGKAPLALQRHSIGQSSSYFMVAPGSTPGDILIHITAS